MISVIRVISVTRVISMVRMISVISVLIDKKAESRAITKQQSSEHIAKKQLLSTEPRTQSRSQKCSREAYHYLHEVVHDHLFEGLVRDPVVAFQDALKCGNWSPRSLPEIKS